MIASGENSVSRFEAERSHGHHGFSVYARISTCGDRLYLTITAAEFLKRRYTDTAKRMIDQIRASWVVSTKLYMEETHKFFT